MSCALARPGHYLICMSFPSQPQYVDDRLVSNASGAPPQTHRSILSRGGPLRRMGRSIFDIVVAYVVTVVLTSMLASPFTVQQHSMSPTTQPGDMVVVERVSMLLSSPHRSQVVVFADPATGDTVHFNVRSILLPWSTASGETWLVKRVIASPGDTVYARNGRVYVNGAPISEPYLDRSVSTAAFGPIKVPPGHVFVLGDNREVSKDSRAFGPIDISTIRGRAWAIIAPLSEVARL